MRANLTWLLLAVLLGLVGLAGGSRADEGAGPRQNGMGTLRGSITLGPTSPVHSPGMPAAPVPAPGIKLLLYGPERQEIAAVTSDAQGEFRVELPPGTYRLEMAPAQGKGFTKDLPATVTIAPGRDTRLNLRLDIGLR
jgi:hypothetical protein